MNYCYAKLKTRHVASCHADGEVGDVSPPPGCLVRVRVECKGGKAELITVENVPSFADQLDTTIDVEGVGSLNVDTAYGGDSKQRRV